MERARCMINTRYDCPDECPLRVLMSEEEFHEYIKSVEEMAKRSPDKRFMITKAEVNINGYGAFLRLKAKCHFLGGRIH